MSHGKNSSEKMRKSKKEEEEKNWSYLRRREEMKGFEGNKGSFLRNEGMNWRANYWDAIYLQKKIN